MLSKEYLTSSVVSYDDMFMNFTQQFLQNFQEIVTSSFETAKCFNFEIEGRSNKKRINPMIRFATLDDIEEIIYIYKDIYDNTYPYKEMEDRQELQKMLNSPNVEWLIFETINQEIVGCFTFMLDFNKKLGNIRGFNLKKKFLGKLDIMKMAMGSIITMYKKYYNKIFRWYGECRTAHSKSQFFLSALGFKPVGFYPCKDVFYNNVESDLLILSYDERALTKMRSEETPKLLPEVLNGFLYSDKRYNLGTYKIKKLDNLKLNHCKIKDLQNSIQKSNSKDKFGYESIKFSLKNSDSFFEFLYTPTVQNFEKTHYKVDSLEELYVFIKEFLKCGKQLEIRYCEAFVSAYEPSHQRLFHNFGLLPRGYVPSWKYNNKTGKFEDCILCNWYKGEINNIQLLKEGKDLVEMLGIQYNYIIKEKLDSSFNTSSSKKNSKIWDLTKIAKSSLMTGLILYLILLFVGLGIANAQGYHITTHTISELGSKNTTHLPILFDISSVLGGITTILFYYYLSKSMEESEYQKNKKVIVISKIRRYAFITGIIGSLGIVFVGIFSLDRAFGLCHNIFSIFAFSGFTCSLLSFGFIILRYDTKIPKKIGIPSMLPLIPYVVQCILASPLLEWMLLFSILFALTPLFAWLTFR